MVGNLTSCPQNFNFRLLIWQTNSLRNFQINLIVIWLDLEPLSNPFCWSWPRPPRFSFGSQCRSWNIPLSSRISHHFQFYPPAGKNSHHLSSRKSHHLAKWSLQRFTFTFYTEIPNILSPLCQYYYLSGGSKTASMADIKEYIQERKALIGRL